jgi:hypothetical protein
MVRRGLPRLPLLPSATAPPLMYQRDAFLSYHVLLQVYNGDAVFNFVKRILPIVRKVGQ